MCGFKNTYIVVYDDQGGSFGMGRIYTADVWREQAFEWSYQDGSFETEEDEKYYKEQLEDMSDEEVIGYISEVWQIRLAKIVNVEGARFAYTPIPPVYNDYPTEVEIYFVSDDIETRLVWQDGFPKGVEINDAEVVKLIKSIDDLNQLWKIDDKFQELIEQTNDQDMKLKLTRIGREHLKMTQEKVINGSKKVLTNC